MEMMSAYWRSTLLMVWGGHRAGERRGWGWTGPSRATSEMRDELRLTLAPEMDHWAGSILHPGWPSQPRKDTTM